MNLLKMKHGEHQCMVFAMAMLLDVSVERVIEIIGHDGMEKIWPYGPPYCYGGIHIQELVDLCWRLGYCLVPIERFPKIGCAKEIGAFKNVWKNGIADSRMRSYLFNRRALLISKTHACAWDGASVYDPNGRIIPLEQFPVVEAWVLMTM